MRVYTYAVGELESNCHIVVDESTKLAVLIDCGGSAERLMHHTTKEGLEVKAILLTHGHYDHFEGAAYVQSRTHCRVYVGAKDAHMLTSSVDSLAKTLGYGTFEPVDDYVTVGEGDTVSEGGFEFKVLSTPGHTEGSVCYLCGDSLFTGDTLFRRSMGRTDFPTGSYFDMQSSLRRLSELGGDYTVYPGHDGNSTLQEERRANPYVRDAVSDDPYAY